MKSSKAISVIVISLFVLNGSSSFLWARTLTEKEKTLRREIYDLEEAYKERPDDTFLKLELANAYNEYGSELVNQGQLEEGETFIMKAFELAPHDISIKQDLALSYSRIGDDKLQDKKRLNEARTAYKRAFLYGGGEGSVLARNIGVSLYNEAVSYVENKDYDIARSLLEDSIKYYPNNPYAFELLGDVAYLNQELDQAQGYWKKAYLLGKTDRISKKLNKLKKEQPIESKLIGYPSERFVIRYVGDTEELEGYDIRQLLREAYRGVSQDFGYYFKTKIPVLLYTNVDYKLVTDTPHWSAGLYDGKVRVPVYETRIKETDLKRTIRHEITHAFVYELSNGKAPVWLNEGLAQYEGNKVAPLDLGLFKVAVRDKSLFNLDELSKKPDELGDTVYVYLYYQQAFMITKFLIDKYKMYKIRELLEELGKGTSFSEALDKVLHISPGALEIHWLASLKDYDKKKNAA